MSNAKFHLTEREEELMELLWDAGEPLTSTEMISAAAERSWKDNYLKVMLRSLLEKGVIRVCGIKQYKTQYARQFEPAVTKEEYVAKFASSRGIKGSAFARVAVAMLRAEDEENVDMTIIEQLEEVIAKLEEKES